MEFTGYSLVNVENVELEKFVELPNPIKLSNGDDVHGVKSGDVFSDGSRLLPVMRDDNSPGEWYKRIREEREVLPDKVIITVIYSEEPDIEEERRHMIVTPLQGRISLLNSHLLTNVLSFINGPLSDENTKIAWEYATEWQRNSSMINIIAKELGLSDTQIDDLFRLAKTINV